MLKRSEAALLLNRIDTTVKRLTTYKGNLPDTNDPQEVAAGELYLANELYKKITARLKVAREVAILEGVTFDTEGSTLKGKDTRLLFDGEHITVSVTVSEGPVKYPHQKMRAEMIRLGMSAKDIEKVFKNSETKNKNAHSFYANVKTEDTIRKGASIPSAVEVLSGK